MPLLFIFLLWPLLEIVVFVQVGAQIGAFAVVALTVATAVAGVALARAQGLATLREVQARMALGEDPGEPALQTLMLLLAGLALLLPGFVSDALGALLLVPQVRHWLVQRLRADLARGSEVRWVRVVRSRKPRTFDMDE